MIERPKSERHSAALEHQSEYYPASPTLDDLLDLLDEYHETTNELIELLALGHKLEPEAATDARKRQSRIAKKLAQLRRQIQTGE